MSDQNQFIPQPSPRQSLMGSSARLRGLMTSSAAIAMDDLRDACRDYLVASDGMLADFTSSFEPADIDTGQPGQLGKFAEAVSRSNDLANRKLSTDEAAPSPSAVVADTVSNALRFTARHTENDSEQQRLLRLAEKIKETAGKTPSLPGIQFAMLDLSVDDPGVLDQLGVIRAALGRFNDPRSAAMGVASGLIERVDAVMREVQARQADRYRDIGRTMPGSDVTDADKTVDYDLAEDYDLAAAYERYDRAAAASPNGVKADDALMSDEDEDAGMPDRTLMQRDAAVREAMQRAYQEHPGDFRATKRLRYRETALDMAASRRFGSDVRYRVLQQWWQVAQDKTPEHGLWIDVPVAPTEG